MADYQTILRVLMERESDQLRNVWVHKGIAFRFTLDGKYDGIEDMHRFQHTVPPLPSELLNQLPEQFW